MKSEWQRSNTLVTSDQSNLAKKGRKLIQYICNRFKELHHGFVPPQVSTYQAILSHARLLEHANRYQCEKSNTSPENGRWRRVFPRRHRNGLDPNSEVFLAVNFRRSRWMVARRSCLASPSLSYLISLEGRVTDLQSRLFYILLGGHVVLRLLICGWISVSRDFFRSFSQGGRAEAEGIGEEGRNGHVCYRTFIILILGQLNTPWYLFK